MDKSDIGIIGFVVMLVIVAVFAGVHRHSFMMNAYSKIGSCYSNDRHAIEVLDIYERRRLFVVRSLTDEIGYVWMIGIDDFEDTTYERDNCRGYDEYKNEYE